MTFRRSLCSGPSDSSAATILTPVFSASYSAASVKLKLSIFIKKANASPPTPQPKQWKGLALGAHDEGRRPFLMERTPSLHVAPGASEPGDVLAHKLDDVELGT